MSKAKHKEKLVKLAKRYLIERDYLKKQGFYEKALNYCQENNINFDSWQGAKSVAKKSIAVQMLGYED